MIAVLCYYTNMKYVDLKKEIECWSIVLITSFVFFLYYFYIYFQQDFEDPILLPAQTNDQLDFNTADSAPEGGFSF
jgi:hypothetical protein